MANMSCPTYTVTFCNKWVNTFWTYSTFNPIKHCSGVRDIIQSIEDLGFSASIVNRSLQVRQYNLCPNQWLFIPLRTDIFLRTGEGVGFLWKNVYPISFLNNLKLKMKIYMARYLRIQLWAVIILYKYQLFSSSITLL